MKFKTAMDVRIGLPNEHLAGSAKNEINQPMYATSVGLIMRGFEHMETYKVGFDIKPTVEYIRPNAEQIIPPSEKKNDVEVSPPPVQEEEKLSFVDKLKRMFEKIIEIEDQSITSPPDNKKNPK
jgi:cell division protein FtsA